MHHRSVRSCRRVDGVSNLGESFLGAGPRIPALLLEAALELLLDELDEPDEPDEPDELEVDADDAVESWTHQRCLWTSAMLFHKRLRKATAASAIGRCNMVVLLS